MDAGQCSSKCKRSLSQCIQNKTRSNWDCPICDCYDECCLKALESCLPHTGNQTETCTCWQAWVTCKDDAPVKGSLFRGCWASKKDEYDQASYIGSNINSPSFHLAKRLTLQRIKSNPTPLKPRPVRAERYARLPSGSCFGVFRHEIQTLNDCKAAALALGIQGDVRQIHSEDGSEEPSRCYIDQNSTSAVFNARETAHDAKAGVYEKICGALVETAEIGSKYDALCPSSPITHSLERFVSLSAL